MIPDFLFNFINTIRIVSIRIFGSKIKKLTVAIISRYYKLLYEGKIHEDIIAIIMKEYYLDDRPKIETCRYYIFSSKQTIDGIYDSKYGKSGRFMSQLFKLIQKIYLDNYVDDTRNSYIEEQNLTMIEINKIFNKVTLYMFAKYDS